MTLTTEQLKARIAHYRELAYRYGKLGNPKHEAQYRNDAEFLEELLANREAQPVAWRHDDGPFAGIAITRAKSVADSWIAKGWAVTPLYTATPAPAVPDGFKLVPTVPNPEMIAAAMNCDDVTFNADETFCVNFGNIYAAMLAAALGQRE